MKELLKEFVEIRFPEDISYGAAGGPVFSTDIVETNNVREFRNINWEEGRLEFNVSYGVRTEDQLHQLLSFFRARRGRAVGFRFKDWSDYKVTNQLIGVGDGKLQNYQLFKTYHSSNIYEIRKIYKPVLDTVKIYNENFVKECKIDYTNGIIELDKPLDHKEKLFADFEFDVPVRFDSDSFHYSNIDHGMYSCIELKVKEIKCY